MPSPPDLPRTQRLIWDLITAPTGVEAGAGALVGAGEIPSPDLSFLVMGDDRLGSADRLGIYADMYFYRLRDCLFEDFPKVAAVIGGARFHNLATDYLLVHPSSSWSLRNLGSALPGFLAGHHLAGERPFLPDLARLEWARVDVFDEADGRSMTKEGMIAAAGDAVAGFRLSMIPACRLLDLEWKVAPIWRSIEDLEAAHEPAAANSASVEASALEEMPAVRIDPPVKEREFIRVWRRGFTVYHRTIGADEHACLDLIARGGATLPAIGDCLLDLAPRRDDGERHEGERAATVSRRIAVLLENWFEDGILRAGD